MSQLREIAATALFILSLLLSIVTVLSLLLLGQLSPLLLLLAAVGLTLVTGLFWASRQVPSFRTRLGRLSWRRRLAS